jgi:hypothetical protein
VAAAAQSPPLAEVARREAERRKTAKATGRVWTNQDLPPVPARVPPAAADAAPAPADAADKGVAPAAAAPPADAVERNETWWRMRIAVPRDTVRRDEILFEALQARVNSLTSEFAAREPYQRARLDDDRQKAVLEMERVRAEIEAAKKAIADIEEEARKADVPPGWLR